MKYLQPFKRLLPALIPSWNFFDIIAPSPRIQFTLLQSKDEMPSHWQEFRPRPSHLSFLQMLKRMLWNPNWNESLYLASCAERIIEEHTVHSENEILNRIQKELPSKKTTTATHLQFRLIFIQRQEDKLIEKVMFTSRIQKIFKGN